jgi:hypothetical protein
MAVVTGLLKAEARLLGGMGSVELETKPRVVHRFMPTLRVHWRQNRANFDALERKNRRF